MVTIFRLFVIWINVFWLRILLLVHNTTFFEYLVATHQTVISSETPPSVITAYIVRIDAQISAESALLAQMEIFLQQIGDFFLLILHFEIQLKVSLLKLDIFIL